MTVNADPVTSEQMPAALSEPATGLARLIGSLIRPVGADVPDHPYRAFLEALAVAVYTTDADGRITFFNEAAVALWGRRPEIGEEWCGSLRLFHRDGRPMAHADCPMAIALKENRPVRGWTAWAERPDGERVAFEPYPTPLRGPDGEVVGAVNVLVDVTDRLLAEEALLESSRALEASNAVKDEFLGLISHELRTPIASIFGNAVLLGARFPDDEPVAGMVRDLGDDADRLLRIVENLLQLTRLGSGTDLDREPQVLEHAVRAAVGSSRRRQPERPIELVIEDPTMIVDADPTSLEMVLDNLLANADKYSPAGRPTEVRVSHDDDTAVVRVLDRGIGIDPASVESIFTAFFRSEHARRTASGIGIGLAVCKRIVDAHGGTIWASPRDGGGTEIGFALPLNADIDVLDRD